MVYNVKYGFELSQLSGLALLSKDILSQQTSKNEKQKKRKAQGHSFNVENPKLGKQ